MDLKLSHEQLTFRDEVRAFVNERLPSALRAKMRRGDLPRKEEIVAWQRILNERGWAAPNWPKEYGGADLGHAERLILQDELHLAPAPVPLGFNVAMLGPLLIAFGTTAQKKYFLPKLANLDLWFCQGFSEPGAGSDLASLRSTATRDNDEYVVNGQKTWQTYAHYADWTFALVRTSQTIRKQDGISLLLIDLRSPGVTIRPISSIDGHHSLNDVFFDNVRVPVTNLVGGEGQGWNCAKFLLSSERVAVAKVGFCRERLDFVRQMAANVRQGGRPVDEDSGLRCEIAGLEAEVRALEITNWRLLATDGGEAGGAFSSVLKLHGSELQQRIAALGVRVAGPIAIEHGAVSTPATPAESMASRYFYSRAVSIYGGASEIQKDILAKVVMG